MTEARDRMYLKHVFVRTITIPTLVVTATQFDLDEPTQEKLYESGRAAAEDLLDKRWSFPEYVKEYRSGAPEHHRSDDTKLKN